MSDPEFGPSMRALPSDLQRAFVEHYVLNGQSDATRAAEAAGYSTTNRKGLNVTAHRLTRDPRIAAAIQEECLKHCVSILPQALRAMAEIINDPAHRDRGMMARHLAAMAGLSPTAKHEVQTKEDPEALKVKAALLARQFGIPVSRLLGYHELSPEEMAAEMLIEHEPAA